MKKNLLFSLMLIMMFGFFVSGMAGCSKKGVIPGELTADEQARLKAEEERRLQEQRLRENQSNAFSSNEAKLRDLFQNQDIHFDYDRYDLRADAKQILNDKVTFLQSHLDLNIIIEGHCDERGSSAYNLALGERRAKSVSAYLAAMGVNATRLETVSYGKERPLVFGHAEEVYAANRRGHFIIK